ncbi:HTH-type transcriptional repressor DasR [Lentzea pudingi]|uniref:HTH-type transcriptional repressor DasR n=1 Tax=Lentzea pudingi TaxID=1789439 RepID=A0ABQ2IFN5_9PSEU|nr:HTH-type transcriptional repressor DasR [Lentzea pudingi]
MSRWLSRTPSVRTVIPRYYQAKARLIDLLGDLPGHSAFPPERTLSDVFGMSRTTIRKALEELVLEGRLIRGTGRQGTFVAPQGRIHRITLDALVQDAVTRERPEVRALVDLVNAESVLLHGDEPIGVRSTYLRAERFPRFAERYDGTPLRRFLTDTYDIRFGDPHPWCTTARATPRVATLLDVRPATPVLSVGWVGTDSTGAQVERSWVVLRGDRAQLALSAPARP